MPRLSGKFQILVDSDAESTANPKRRILDLKMDLNDISISQWETKYLLLADGTIDQTIGLDGIDPEYLLIISNQNITFNLNGLSLELSSNFPFLYKGSITSVLISNASGSSAEVNISLGR